MTSSTRHAIATSGVLVSAVALLYSAQQAPAPKPFKSEVTAVEVDVVATRKSGERVRGLRQEDFEVFEDGAPVTIASFSAIDLPDLPPRESTPLPAAPNRSGSAFGSNDQPHDGRIVLIALDDVQFGFTAGRVAIAKSIARRAVERLQPGDLAAVMTTGGRAEFTSDKARLLEAIDGFKPQGEHELPDAATSTPPGPGAGGAAVSGSGSSLRLDSTTDPRLMNMAQGRTVAAMNGLTAAVRALGTIRNRRKSVLMVSQGFPATLEDMQMLSRLGAAGLAVRDFMMAAQRNNVAIYTVDPCGLEMDWGCSRQTRANLQALAEETGGLATINTNAPEAAIDRMLADSGSYYLIAYYSPAAKNDGKSHKITVRTRVPGVEIRARAGYEAPRKAEQAASALKPVDALTSAAIQARGLTMRVVAIPVPLAGNPGAAVVIGLELASAAAARAGRIEFAAVAVDQNGTPRARVRFTTDFTGRTGPTWTRTGSRLDLAPGRYDLRIAAAGADQSAGSVFTEVTVPDFRAALAVGGLSIGAETGVPITAADRARGALPLIPFAANELSRGVTAALQLPITVAAKAASQPLTIVATLTGPDGVTQPLDRIAGNARDYAGAGGRVHTVTLPSTLGAGRYRLTVETTLGTTTIVRALALTVP
jgi:VWFA-related protein